MTEVNECYESRPFGNSYLAKVYDDDRGGCSILSYRRTRMRALVAENPYAPYVLMVGNRVQIKRKLFEQFLDEANAL